MDPVSLEDALTNADTAVPEVANVAEAAPTPEPEWELPGWATTWDEPDQLALKQLRGLEPAKEHFDRLLGRIDKISTGFGRQGHEYGNYRRQMDPIAEVISPYVQQFQMNGMTPQQGLTQVLAFADSLARNPDQTFPQLATMYKPSNAGQVIQALAQAWGADLGQVTQEQPYIDPVIQEMVGGVAQELRSIKEWKYQQEQYARSAQQAAVLHQLDAFTNAKDETGAPKYPHLDRLQNQMAAIINSGLVDRRDHEAIAKAYTMAFRLDPDLSNDDAEKRALAAAARQTATATKAADASRNVSGKPNGRDTAPSTLEEALAAAERQFRTA